MGLKLIKKAQNVQLKHPLEGGGEDSASHCGILGGGGGTP